MINKYKLPLINGESIYTTKDKSKFFKNLYNLKFNNTLDLSDFVYINARTKSIVNTQYGKCLIEPSKLLEGCMPCITSAINKTEYFINKAREKWRDKYDYSLINYTKAHNKVRIICKIHGEFDTIPGNHINSITGCGKCGFDNTNNANKKDPTGWNYSIWENRATRSKYFDGFKLYILYCYNEDTDESFYKVGKTYVTVKERIRSSSRFPYKYKILATFNSTAVKISKLEKILQKINKNNKYLPLIDFDGKYECFSQLNTKTWNFIKKYCTQTETFI